MMENQTQNLQRLIVSGSVISALAAAGLLAQPVFSASKANTEVNTNEKVSEDLTSEEKKAIATIKAGCCEG